MRNTDGHGYVDTDEHGDGNGNSDCNGNGQSGLYAELHDDDAGGNDRSGYDRHR